MDPDHVKMYSAFTAVLFGLKNYLQSLLVPERGFKVRMYLLYKIKSRRDLVGSVLAY